MESPVEENKRYKWPIQATDLLVTVWSNEQIQNQLKATCRIQPIWDSIGKYMTKKGFKVSGLQCRTRIKNMTRQYQDAMTKGNTMATEDLPYYNVFQKIIIEKAHAREEKASRVQASKAADTSEDSENGEIQVLEDDLIADDPAAVASDDPAAAVAETAYCAVDSTELENLLSNNAHVQTQVLKELLTESVRSLERLIRSESERILRVVAEEAEQRRELGRRLDRLLTRVEAAVVPPLAYMGT